MRKFFSSKSSCCSVNDILAPLEPNKGRKVSSQATQERILDGYQTPEDCVLKQNQNLEAGSSSNLYLQMSLSLTSAAPAICNSLNEGSSTSSSDQSRMTSCRDNDLHVGRYHCSHGSLTPDRHGRVERKNLRINAFEKPRSPGSFGVHQNSSDSKSACSPPIRSQLAERSFANERLKQSKLELNTRTRRLENKKNELQLSLENELDRRSNEGSLKLSEFQAEEQRQRERVRELAEQNESLQRENFSFQGSELDIRNYVVNIERQLNESKATQADLKAENFNLRQELLELQERCNEAEEKRDHVKMSSKEIERENMELQKLVGRLQRTCNEQDKTISSSELDIVQLQKDLTFLLGRYDQLSTNFQMLKDDVYCLNHIKRDLEVQMLKKDENFLLLQQDLQQCSRELTATKSMLTNVSEERDHFCEEMKQLRKNNMIMDCELKSLNKKIELLDHYILYKEGQISILKDSLHSKAF